MKLIFFVAALAAAAYADNKHSSPKVQLYTRKPGSFGEENVLICHASHFHPPDLTIQLLDGDKEMPKVNQTDLAFSDDWRFHLTMSAAFTPVAGHQYSCRITHGEHTPKTYVWDPNM